MRKVFALFLGLVVGISASAEASAADAACALKPIVTIGLHQYPDGRMGVPMTLNGRPSQLMLDTGGGVRALKATVADELGLTRFNADLHVRNLEGHESHQQVRVQTVTFADAGLSNVVFSVMAAFDGDQRFESLVPVMTDKEREFLKREAVDGLLAPDLFKADMDLDFANKRMTLFDQNHCKGQVVYWPAQAVAVVPFHESGNHIVIDAQLDGKKLQAVLDTGATLPVLSLDVAQRKFGVNVADDDVQKETVLGKAEKLYHKRFKSLSFGGVAVASPLVRLEPLLNQDRNAHVRDPQAPQAEDMLIGAVILQKLHVFIAWREQKLYITPASGLDVALPLSGAARPGAPDDSMAHPR